MEQRSTRADDRRTLRIAHLVRTLDWGGLERVVLDLCGVDRTRFEPRVVCLGALGAMASECDRLGVPVVALGAGNRVSALLALRRHLRDAPADVLHSHNPLPHATGALARVLGAVPALVHTKHGRNYPGVRRAVLQNRLATTVTDALVAVSENAAAVARDVERVPAAKLLVIHNGIDVTAFRPRDRSCDAPARAVHVARLDTVKDQATLLRAARLVADAVPGFHLDVVGDGPERGALQQLHAELKLERHVTLHGFRSDVAAFLERADLFLLSSRSEGIALTLLEAMAAGLPIVATEVGGNREVVVQDETGLLAPVARPEALAAAILELLRDPARWRAMGVAARRRVEERFDLRNVLRRYEEVYLRVTTNANS